MENTRSLKTNDRSLLEHASSEALEERTDQRSHESARDLFDRCVALGLLILASPLILAVALVIWIFDGRPLFYSGERLGLGQEPFQILKFRTLAIDAEQRVGASLLRADHRVETRTGRFFRDTRLDELPQLWNVIRGDMALFGPRPERKAVFEEHCRSIPGYEKRFYVKPGLVGLSQLFTPHGTPKKMRSWLDGRMIERPIGAREEFLLICLTGWTLLKSATHRAGRWIRNKLVRQWLLGQYREQRFMRRVSNFEAQVERRDAPNATWQVVDANEKCLRVRGAGLDALLEQESLTLRASLRPHSGRFIRTRIRVQSSRLRGQGEEPEALLDYSPNSDAGRYFIDQYLLGRSMVRWWRRSAWES